MNRRQFIKMALLSTTYSLLVGCDESGTDEDGSVTDSENSPQETNGTQSTQKTTQVLIIGAGSSGLAAARTLVDNDYEVIVLEGRDRLGGRTWTSHYWSERPLDMGASWIQGTEDNPLTELSERLGIKTVVTDTQNPFIYDADGTRISEEDLAALEELLDQLYTAIDEELDLNESMSLQDAVDRVVAEADLDEDELRGINYALSTVIEHEYAASTTELSAMEWNEGSGFGGDDVVFPDGYVQIVNYLAKGVDVRLNHAVSQITYGDDGVTVTTNKGTFQAKQVIVTVPLGVLQKGSIQFSPALPRAKQNAIANLGMGLLDKLYLRFDRAFWDEEVVLIGYVSEEWGHWAEIVNFYAITGDPILLAFNAATFAREIEPWSDEEIVADFMAVLRTIYGDDIPEPNDWQITRWAKDPFAFGSYSYMKVGATPSDREALAEPLSNSLFFAGEATSVDYPSTVHGAYLSGLRAAEEVMDAG